MRQFANFGMAHASSTESTIAVIRQICSIKPPDLKKIEKKLRNCSQLLDKLLPITVSSKADGDLHYSFSEQSDIKDSGRASSHNEKNASKLLLNKEHWKLKSEISARTYFENNYAPRPTKTATFYFHQKPFYFLANAPQQLSFSRGFKTRRSDPDARTSMNEQKNQDAAFGGFQELRFGENKK